MDVVFFPRNDYPNNVEVCAHRLGKKMTFTEQSDRIMPSTSFPWIYALSQTYNLKIGFFAIYSDFATQGWGTAKIALDAGNIWLDEYSLVPSIYEKIVNSEVITENEFNSAYNQELLPYFMSAIGKKPVCMSYAYGTDNFKDYVIPKYLAARNSYTDEHTDYGMGKGSPNNVAYSVANFKSRASTIRWYDKALSDSSFAEGIAEVADMIDDTLSNGGWLNNFTHFHSVQANGHQSIYEQYFQMLANKNANGEIYFAGYGEAVAYLVYRQMITKVVMYSPVSAANDKLVIRLETKNSLSVDTDLLQVPISVKFSTVGTPLAGQTIKSSHNLISLGSGQYIVEIPYAEYPSAVIEKVSI